MDTGTCSFRSAFKNGSCNNCPLLLIANSVLFFQVGRDCDEEKEIRRQSLHYSRFSFSHQRAPAVQIRRNAWYTRDSAFVRVRVRARTELYAQWSPNQPKSFSKA